MKLIFFILILFTGVSCRDTNFIYYEFDDIIITREIIGTDNYFYFGYCNNSEKKCPDNYIRIYYSGFNSIMGAHLIFGDEKKVAFVRLYGQFDVKKKPSNFYMEDFNLRSKRYHWREDIRGNFNNVVYISDVLDEEREINKLNHSKVKVTYPND